MKILWLLEIVLLYLHHRSAAKNLGNFDSKTTTVAIESGQNLPVGPPVRITRRSIFDSYNPSGYAPLPAFSPSFYHGLRTQNAAYLTNSGVVSTLNTLYPRYEYSSNDTGNDDLGNHLKCSFHRMNRPTYYHYRYPGFINGYTPRYGHYKVHHHKHARDSIPANTTIDPEAIVDCPEESQTICPASSISLCTNNGNLLCVIESEKTSPCPDQNPILGKCFDGRIPRVDNTCNSELNINVSLPCISFVNITGSIAVQNKTLNIGEETVDISMMNVSLASQNVTEQSPVKISTREFCVVLLAVPAEREYTKQEQTVNRAGGMLVKFLSRVHALKESNDDTSDKINKTAENGSDISITTFTPSRSEIITLETLGIHPDSYGDLMTPILLQIDDELRKKNMTSETINLGEERYSLKTLGVNVTKYPSYLRPIWNEIDYELGRVPS